jgi:23S rRNA (pseudouridine1915-N3)-methyltransferase
MNWQVLHVGKTSFPWVLEGVDTYAKRLKRRCPMEVISLKQGTVEAFGKVTTRGVRVCLDEGGALLSTLQVAEKVKGWQMEGVKEVQVCIGGADGLPVEVIRSAHEVWSFGRMTLMHELALLVWMEQLYRVIMVLEDHPYHREG